jgi:hypothetical protein
MRGFMANLLRRLLTSKRAAVEVLYGYRGQVDILDAPDIDGCHGFAIRTDAFPIRMDAARRAETVLDDVLVERVDSGRVVRRQEMQMFARHEPEQGTLALANRAIAGHRSSDFAFDLERNLAAVATASVSHVAPQQLIYRVSYRQTLAMIGADRRSESC